MARSRVGEVLSVENPARRQVIAHVPRGSTPDVDIAVDHASEAYLEQGRAAGPRPTAAPDRRCTRIPLPCGEQSRAEARARIAEVEQNLEARRGSAAEAATAAEAAGQRLREKLRFNRRTSTALTDNCCHSLGVVAHIEGKYGAT